MNSSSIAILLDFLSKKKKFVVIFVDIYDIKKFYGKYLYNANIMVVSNEKKNEKQKITSKYAIFEWKIYCNIFVMWWCGFFTSSFNSHNNKLDYNKCSLPKKVSVSTLQIQLNMLSMVVMEMTIT